MGRKSTLMTADPYHIPGYCGYVQQFKYRIGETFGNHTHGLLTDTSLNTSNNSVLASTEPKLSHSLKAKEGGSDACPTSSNYVMSQRWGNQKYIPQMVPGYTGYVPKKLNYFGSRYAETSRYAISDFQTDRQHYESKRREMKNGGDTSTRLVQTPLQPISSKPKPYPPMYTKQHPVSPFVMPVGHSQKFFMSGYTGFVPKARKYLGQGYPIITRKALHEDAIESSRLEAARHAPVVVNRQSELLVPLSVLYTKGQGLMPHYTGHIPGERYKYGMTFGTSTQRAISEIA